MSTKSVELNNPADGDWVRLVRRAVQGLRYGSVEVLVHDGRVVQVETRQKVRFADDRSTDERKRITTGVRPAHPDEGGMASEETDE